MPLEYPPWSILLEKARIFEKEVNNKLSKPIPGQSDKHKFIESAFRTSLHILPLPFDAIAESIYDSVDGYEREKLSEVKDFLHTLTKKGERHYASTAPRLGGITSDVLKLKNEIAKKSTLLYIRDILMGKYYDINQQIYRITKAQEDLIDY